MKTNDKELRFIEVHEIECRANNSNEKIIEGYAMKWNKLSVPIFGFREKFLKGAFSKGLRKNNVLSFWNHNEDMILGSISGRSLELTEDDIGLKFRINLPNTTVGNDTYESIKRKDVRGVSVGFNPYTVIDEWDHTPSERGEPIIRTVKQADLIELSPTHSPAYPQTWVSARSFNPLKKHMEELENIEKESEEKQKRQIERNKQIRENLLKNKGVI